MDRFSRTRERSAPALELTVCCVVAASAAVLSLSADASAGAKRVRGGRLSVAVDTPLGLQGTAGVGRTALPFRVYDRTGRKIAIQVEYGWDRNGDGVIADGSDPSRPSEFERATQVRRDPRDTSRVRVSRKGSVATYRAHKDGAAHAFVWSSGADLGGLRLPAGAQLLRDETGRAIADRFNPGSLAMGPALPGVRLRLRAVVKGRKGARTEWQVSEPFSVDNTSAPTARIDDVEVIAGAEHLVAIDWTGFDADSEDVNGNRVLDVLELEDRDGDGQLDETRLAVHVDFYPLAAGEAVPQSETVLGDLAWRAATHAAGEGDPATGILVAPAPLGGAATFVWNTSPDLYRLGVDGGRFLVRLTPYDETGNVGRPVHHLTPIVIAAGQ